jgi:hypothetical protein
MTLEEEKLKGGSGGDRLTRRKNGDAREWEKPSRAPRLKRMARHEKLSRFNANKSYAWHFDGTHR